MQRINCIENKDYALWRNKKSINLVDFQNKRIIPLAEIEFEDNYLSN